MGSVATRAATLRGLIATTRLRRASLFLCSGGLTLLSMIDTPSTRLPSSIFFFLVLVGVVQANFYAAQMPPTLASHFRSGGMANGWQSKFAFFCTEVAVVVLASVISFGLPRIMGAVPVSLINVPNKEFWFGPAQRQQTLAFFKVQFAWFGCGLLAFLLFVNELVFRANLSPPHRLNTTAFVTAMAVFLTFVVIWIARLILRFSRTTK
jgi:hypothetical protein